MTDNLEALAPFKSSAEELLNDTDSVTLLAAALKLLTKEPDTTPVNITEEKPLRVRRRREGGRSDRRRRDGDRRRGMTAPVAVAMIVEVIVAMTVKVTAAEMIVNLIVRVARKNHAIKGEGFKPYFKD